MLRPPHSPQISEVNNLHYLDVLRSLLHARSRASLGAFSCSRPRPPPALRRARRRRARRARPWGTRRQGAGERRGRRRRACAALSASQQHTNPHSFLPLSGPKELLQRPRPRLGRLGARIFLGLHVTSRQSGEDPHGCSLELRTTQPWSSGSESPSAGSDLVRCALLREESLGVLVKKDHENLDLG